MNIIQFGLSLKIELPYFESWVQAGFPSPAEDYEDKKLDLNELIIRHPASTFFVRVVGDSMLGAGIFPGDILVVDRYPTPKSGQVVVAVINGEFTVKRFIKKGEKVVLLPANNKYKPIELGAEQELTIWGVVIRVLHDPNQ